MVERSIIVTTRYYWLILCLADERVWWLLCLSVCVYSTSLCLYYTTFNYFLIYSYQITAALPYPLEIDMVFESGLYSAAMSISGNHLIDAMKIKNSNFDKRYNLKYTCKTYIISQYYFFRFENNFKLISKVF